jgi:hypothetical protein
MKNKFKNFLFEYDDMAYRKTRSASIEKESELLKMLSSDYTDAVKAFNNGNKIFRGTSSTDDYMITDPSIGTRISANTYNYYTLVIDNSSAWKAYPKRSKSIICTSSPEYADEYGTIYAVFPINGSKIGVCSDEDFWDSFPVLTTAFTRAGIDAPPLLDTLTRFLGQLIGLIGSQLYIKTLPTLKKAFTAFDTFIADKEYTKRPSLNTKALFTILEMLDYKGNLFTSVENLLDPVKNKFKLENIRDFTVEKHHEVWTSGKSIMINIDKVDDIISQLEN